MIDINKIQKDKVMRPLESYIDQLVENNIRLNKKLCEYDKDEEVATLKDEIKRLRIHSVHIRSKKELEQSIEFKDMHWERCNGNISYTVVGSGIGSTLLLKCSKCGESKNVTDFEDW